MSKLTKNQKLAAEKIEAGKAYSLKEAAQLVKEISLLSLTLLWISTYVWALTCVRLTRW